MKVKPKIVVAKDTSDRVQRGGSDFSVAQLCRSAYRDRFSGGGVEFGFRLVKPVKKAK